MPDLWYSGGNLLSISEKHRPTWRQRVNKMLHSIEEDNDMDEQIEKAEEVAEYTETHPQPIDPATGLPYPNPITMPEVEAAESEADDEGSEIETEDEAAA